METLRQFLDRREAEVRDQLKVLKAELAEMKRVRIALNGEAPAQSAAPANAAVSGQTTIKDMIRVVIMGRFDGLTSSDFITTIEMVFGVVLERTSLSPQLSRLGRDGEIKLIDGRWYPTDQLSLPQVESRVSGVDSAPETPDDTGPDGRRDGYPPIPSEGSIPSGSTPVANSPAYANDFADDLDDDVPF